MNLTFTDITPVFDGKTYVHERDGARLGDQMQAVYDVMKDGDWRTLRLISIRTGFPEASISARLRDLRKERFGGHQVERLYITKGLFQYRVIVRDKS